MFLEACSNPHYMLQLLYVTKEKALLSDFLKGYKSPLSAQSPQLLRVGNPYQLILSPVFCLLTPSSKPELSN